MHFAHLAIIAVQSLPETQVMVPNKFCNTSIPKTDPNKNCLYQYAIEHKMDPEEFSIITEAEKINGLWDVPVAIWKEIYDVIDRLKCIYNVIG